LKLIEYAIWLVLAGVLGSIVMSLKLVTTTLDAEGISRGDFQIAVFILMVLFITIGFVMSRR